MQTIIDARFVQWHDQSHLRRPLKGWDERNGGNLTLRLDEADIEPYAADFHAKPRYIALSQPMPTPPTSRLSSPAPANSSVTSSSTRPLTSAW